MSGGPGSATPGLQASGPPLAIQPYDADDDLLAAIRQDGRAHVRWRRFHGLAVVLGRGGRPEVELRLERIRRDNVPVLQRPGGGCAVLLDPGNILFAAALPLPGIAGIHRAFARISLWLIDRLAQAGVPSVRPAGVSDLALGDRKIGGACMYRTRGLLYYATTLLVNPDLALVERYLRHPPREPEYRQGRPHRLFMGRLADLAGVTDGDDFVAALHHAGEAQPLTLDWPS